MTIIKTVNIKSDRPTVHQACERLDGGDLQARQQKSRPAKTDSQDTDRRAREAISEFAVQRLQELFAAGQIAGCILGAEWAKSSEEVGGC